MIETNYKQLVETGLALKRNEIHTRVFTDGIGSEGNRRWSPKPFNLTPMQVAILDTLYDLEKGSVMNAKQMVNDLTRRAALMETGKWTIASRRHRLQSSCGVDERDCNKYTLFKYSVVDKKLLRDVDKTWYTDEEGCPTYEEFQEMAEEAYEQLLTDHPESSIEDFSVSRYPNSFYSFRNDNHYKGECAWTHGAKGHHRCKHHAGAFGETVVGLYRHRETGQERSKLYHEGRYRSNRAIEDADEYDFIYWDEQDQESLVSAVEDNAVIRIIRETIPKMKTEAREWLKSTWTEYGEYNKETQSRSKTSHGKRGHYCITWNTIKERIIKDEQNKVLFSALDGQKVNGWTFKKNNGYGSYATGEWKGETTVFRVSTGGWSHRGVADGMKFLDRHSAQDLCDLLNNSYFIARSIGADGCIPKPFKVMKVKQEVTLTNELRELCEKYTPEDYFQRCNFNTLDKGEHNEYCSVEDSE